MQFSKIQKCIQGIENNLDALHLQGRHNAYVLYATATLIEELKQYLAMTEGYENKGEDIAE